MSKDLRKQINYLCDFHFKEGYPKYNGAYKSRWCLMCWTKNKYWHFLEDTAKIRHPIFYFLQKYIHVHYLTLFKWNKKKLSLYVNLPYYSEREWAIFYLKWKSGVDKTIHKDWVFNIYFIKVLVTWGI